MIFAPRRGPAADVSEVTAEDDRLPIALQGSKYPLSVKTGKSQSEQDNPRRQRAAGAPHQRPRHRVDVVAAEATGVNVDGGDVDDLGLVLKS
jgi:hypothetical protein